MGSIDALMELLKAMEFPRDETGYDSISNATQSDFFRPPLFFPPFQSSNPLALDMVGRMRDAYNYAFYNLFESLAGKYGLLSKEFEVGGFQLKDKILEGALRAATLLNSKSLQSGPLTYTIPFIVRLIADKVPTMTIDELGQLSDDLFMLYAGQDGLGDDLIDRCRELIPIQKIKTSATLRVPFGTWVNIGGMNFRSLLDAKHFFSIPELASALQQTENGDAYMKLSRESQDVAYDALSKANGKYGAVIIFGQGRGALETGLANLLLMDYNRFRDDTSFYFMDISRHDLESAWLQCFRTGILHPQLIEADFSVLGPACKGMRELKRTLYGQRVLGIGLHIIDNYLPQQREGLLDSLSSLFKAGDRLVLTAWGPQTQNHDLAEAYQRDLPAIRSYAEKMGIGNLFSSYHIEVLEDQDGKHVVMYGAISRTHAQLIGGKYIRLKVGDKGLLFYSGRLVEGYPAGQNHSIIDIHF